MTKTYCIIVAAGTGTRFGSDIPKQFLPLGSDGMPVLMHTVNAFMAAGIERSDIRVILSEEMSGFWKELCFQHGFDSPPVVFGGKMRFHSVQNALRSLNCRVDDLVLIHDGVRPLINKRTIINVVDALSNAECVIPVIPESNSLREIMPDGATRSVERSRYLAVQTPQGFRSGAINKAYRTDFRPEFTDDASVAEAAGFRIITVPGEPDNIKITNPKDLKIAEVLLSMR